MDGISTTAEHLIQRVLSAIFAGEAFVPLHNKGVMHQKRDQRLPFVELLARHKNGQSAGHLFDEAREHNCVVEADLIALENVVKAQLDLDFPVSINLNVETFFSEELAPKVRELIHKYPKFNPEDFCLEITEQGGIPKNFDANKLLTLKQMGFALALDDFDPRQAIEQFRLTKFAPYVDIVKFPYQVLEMVRDGSLREAETLANTIKDIKDEFPHITFVMEGVRATDGDLLSTLKQMGIDLIQATSYVGEPRVDLSKKIAFPLPAISLAQPA